MARRKKVVEDVEEVVVDVPEVVETASFNASNFTIAAATVPTIDVTKVTGTSQVGKTTNYAASASVAVTEASASIDNVRIVGSSVSAGNVLGVSFATTTYSSSGTYDYTFAVTHSVTDVGIAAVSQTGQVEVTTTDGTGTVATSSSSFTLSASEVPGNLQAFAPLSQKWRGRMIDEGLI